jgi:Flp pilus assembly protein TadD
MTIHSHIRRQGPVRLGRCVTQVFTASPALLGVSLVMALSELPRAQPTPMTTFARDIAPIVFSRCATCHHPGGPAPFSLLTYDETRRRASLIVAATKSRFMPPWKASPRSGPFVGQSPLSADEIDVLERWAANGAVEGDPRDLPPTPRFPDGWQLGTPDLVVAPSEPFTLQAEGTDVFRIFVIALPTNRTRFVRGLEFRPGNPKVVHHANIRLDRTDASRRYDERDQEPGYEGLIAHSATYPDGHFLGWTPGQVAPLLPKGMAWRLEPGTDLVVEVHMQPSGKPERVLPSIGVHFASDPPARTPVMLRLGRQNIDIAPGDASYAVIDSFTLPVDVEVQAVQPHAHHRARRISGVATLPDGTTQTLIEIDDWDFRWQHVYRFVTPLELPSGTTLSMRYTFDNSAANPRNPALPPRRVVWGQRSSDEMGDLWIQVLTKNPRDLATLVERFRPKVLAEDLVGYERVLESEPDSVALHDDVAQLYLELGRPNEASAHFAASARLSPQSAAAHFNLGTSLAVAGHLDEAMAEFQLSLTLRPDYARAHNNLASILLRRGETDEALRHAQDAIRLEPSNVEAHTNLAAAYAASGRFDRAITAIESALRLKPPDSVATVLRARLEAYRRSGTQASPK